MLLLTAIAVVLSFGCATYLAVNHIRLRRFSWPARMGDRDLARYCRRYLQGQGWEIKEYWSQWINFKISRDGLTACISCRVDADSISGSLLTLLQPVRRDMDWPVIVVRQNFSESMEFACAKQGVALLSFEKLRILDEAKQRMEELSARPLPKLSEEPNAWSVLQSESAG